ncbi:hypothetical protein P6F26_16840 [Roseibacterium sp. SDUM158017]|uniref:hypothetical protein n=1 Tax=Roseicyclus salinarum TaxID=3036773 RepID=UPI002415805F|nr:hypothetical protein [Roseibacterium sp. SDUM158017]MDG4650117.1 hypothetical protein [Roseibacterium sp. SDUM158017]
MAEYRVDPGPLEWLIELLHDAGPVGIDIGGFGVVYRGLTWVEIVAWVEGGEMHDVSPFWRRQIMRMSDAMAAAMNRASEPETAPPFQPN